MKELPKTSEQLLRELDQARRTIAELKETASHFKRLQDTLLENEEGFLLHFSLSNDVMFSYDSDFRVQSVSPNVERLLGYRPEDLIGKTFHEVGVLDPADMEKAMDNAMHVLSGGVVYASIYRFITRDGLHKFGEVSGVPMKRGGMIIGVISVARDITERMRMEEELQRYRSHLEDVVSERTAEILQANERLREEMHDRMQAREDLRESELKLSAYRGNLESLVKERTAALTTANEVLTREVEERRRAQKALSENEEKYRLYFSLSNDVMFSWDNEFRVLSVSPNVERLLGYRPDELVGRVFHELDVLDPADMEEALENAMHLLAGRKVSSSIFRFITKDGRKKFGELTEVPVTRDGKVVKIITVAREITERIELLDSLRDCEETTQALLNATADSLILLDPAGKVLALNKAAAQRLGKDVNAILWSRIYDHIPKDVAKQRKVFFDEVLNSGKPLSFIDERHGKYYQNSLYPVRDPRGKVSRIAVYTREIAGDRHPKGRRHT